MTNNFSIDFYAQLLNLNSHSLALTWDFGFYSITVETTQICWLYPSLLFVFIPQSCDPFGILSRQVKHPFVVKSVKCEPVVIFTVDSSYLFLVMPQKLKRVERYRSGQSGRSLVADKCV